MRRLHGLRQRVSRTAPSSRRSCPRPTRAAPSARFAAEDPDRGRAAADLRAQFVRTKKYAEVPERNGIAARGVRPVRRSGPLQGLRRVRRGVRRPRARRPVHDGQGRRRPEGRVDDRPGCRDDDAFLRSLPPTPDGLPEREGARRPHARRARLRLRRRGRLLRRLRRGDRDPDDGGGDAAGHGPTRWGSSRRPAATPSSAARIRSTRTSCPWTNSLFENAPAVASGIRARWDQAGHPGSAALGHRRRRRDVRHRLPGAVADGRLRRGHQGARPRHAGLLEHRRPGVDRIVRQVRSPSCPHSVPPSTGAPNPARSLGGS